MKEYNLGNISEKKAAELGRVVLDCWRDHNTALILSDSLTALKKDWSGDLRFFTGVTMGHILTFGLNLSSTLGHQEIDLLREQVIITALSSDWNEYVMVHSYAVFLKQLSLVLSEIPQLSLQRNMVDSMHDICLQVLSSLI